MGYGPKQWAPAHLGQEPIENTAILKDVDVPMGPPKAIEVVILIDVYRLLLMLVDFSRRILWNCLFIGNCFGENVLELLLLFFIGNCFGENPLELLFFIGS